MTPVLLVLIPLAGGLAAAWAGKVGRDAPRWVSLASLGALLGLTALIAARGTPPGSPWYAEVNLPWIEDLGVRLHLAVDGVSILLVALTAFLGIAAVLASFTEIRERTGFFHFNLLWCLAGITGVFVSLDLFVFYLFWELMLVPMYLLIALWGHEGRRRAAVKFFIFTQLSGLLMLASMIAMSFMHLSRTGAASFDYTDLLALSPGPASSAWLLAGFLAAFLVKLPAVALHAWLPDAHAQAPTAGSVVLAGLLLKTGAYGVLRFAIPLFPEAASRAAPLMMVLAVVGILYGAMLAFAQSDLKRMVAYTSVSHMGFVLLGLFSWNEIALQGAMIQIICHGLSTGALFMMAGALGDRLGTRDMDRMGGFWRGAPRMGTMTMLFAMASLGLPGLGNFVGEFLVVLGAFPVSPAAASAAAAGFVLSAVYALWMMQRVFFGPRGEGPAVRDLTARETLAAGMLAAGLLFLGLYPQPAIDAARPALTALQGTWKGQQPPAAAQEQRGKEIRHAGR